MGTGAVVLGLVFTAGLLGGNDLVAAASAVVLVARLLAHPGVFQFLEAYATQLGITFLLIGLLLPFATGQMGLAAAARSLATSRGVVAIGIGALGAYLAAEGISLLHTRPEVMVGIVFGSVLGVSFLGGIPAGPLVAAGLAAMVFRLFTFW